MYKIGIFSKINHITTTTLRHYDEIGLLIPEYVDNLTGYRYYSSSQLPKLHKILNLKEMGLSLMEIKGVLDNDDNIKEYLLLRKAELQDDKNNIAAKLLQIENYLNGDNEQINPIIKPLPEVIIASMRITVPRYDIYFDIVPRMEKEMKKSGAICAKPKYVFNIYPDEEYKETNISVDVCEAVIDFCQDTELVKYKKLNTVDKAICVLHKGSYHTLRATYILTYQWIDKNGYKAVGLPRESYIDGIWNKENEDDWLTEIQVPIFK